MYVQLYIVPVDRGLPNIACLAVVDHRNASITATVFQTWMLLVVCHSVIRISPNYTTTTTLRHTGMLRSAVVEVNSHWRRYRASLGTKLVAHHRHSQQQSNCCRWRNNLLQHGTSCFAFPVLRSGIPCATDLSMRKMYCTVVLKLLHRCCAMTNKNAAIVSMDGHSLLIIVSSATLLQVASQAPHFTNNSIMAPECHAIFTEIQMNRPAQESCPTSWQQPQLHVLLWPMAAERSVRMRQTKFEN